MTISFKSILTSAKPFRAESTVDGDTVILEGELARTAPHYITLKAKLRGDVTLACDSCAESYSETVDEPIELILTDTVLSSGDESGFIGDEMKYDIIEFPDGQIDIDEIIAGEINTIKYDYHKCKTCQNEGE